MIKTSEPQINAYNGILKKQTGNPTKNYALPH